MPRRREYPGTGRRRARPARRVKLPRFNGAELLRRMQDLADKTEDDRGWEGLRTWEVTRETDGRVTRRLLSPGEGRGERR